MTTRQEALRGGLTKYLGRSCPRGHDGWRYTNGGKCIQCSRDFSSSGAKKAYDAEYMARNRDRILAQQAARYRLKREERLAYSKRWAANNPERAQAYKEKNKAHRRMLSERPAPWFGELDELVMAEARSLARLRRRVTGIAWHVDHEVPLRGRLVCGLHVWNNIRVIPAALNLRKSNSWTA